MKKLILSLIISAPLLLVANGSFATTSTASTASTAAYNPGQNIPSVYVVGNNNGNSILGKNYAWWDRYGYWHPNYRWHRWHRPYYWHRWHRHYW